MHLRFLSQKLRKVSNISHKLLEIVTEKANFIRINTNSTKKTKIATDEREDSK